MAYVIMTSVSSLRHKLQTTFRIRSSGHKQKHGVEASRAKIQQIYENLELDLDLKLLFMVTGAYYESGLLRTCTEC